MKKWGLLEIVYAENLKASSTTKKTNLKTLEIINNYIKVSVYKVNVQKQIVFIMQSINN